MRPVILAVALAAVTLTPTLLAAATAAPAHPARDAPLVPAAQRARDAWLEAARGDLTVRDPASGLTLREALARLDAMRGTADAVATSPVYVGTGTRAVEPFCDSFSVFAFGLDVQKVKVQQIGPSLDSACGSAAFATTFDVVGGVCASAPIVEPNAGVGSGFVCDSNGEVTFAGNAAVTTFSFFGFTFFFAYATEGAWVLQSG